MLSNEERLKVPAHQTDTTANLWDEMLDLGPARLPILVHVSEYSRAWNRFPHLVDFLGHHSWMNHFPSLVPSPSLNSSAFESSTSTSDATFTFESSITEKENDHTILLSAGTLCPDTLVVFIYFSIYRWIE